MEAQISLVFFYVLEVFWNRHQYPEPIGSMLYAGVSQSLMKSEKMKSNAELPNQHIWEIQVQIVKNVEGLSVVVFFLIYLF